MSENNSEVIRGKIKVTHQGVELIKNAMGLGGRHHAAEAFKQKMEAYGVHRQSWSNNVSGGRPLCAYTFWALAKVCADFGVDVDEVIIVEPPVRSNA